MNPTVKFAAVMLMFGMTVLTFLTFANAWLSPTDMIPIRVNQHGEGVAEIFMFTTILVFGGWASWDEIRKYWNA